MQIRQNCATRRVSHGQLIENSPAPALTSLMTKNTNKLNSMTVRAKAFSKRRGTEANDELKPDMRYLIQQQRSVQNMTYENYVNHKFVVKGRSQGINSPLFTPQKLLPLLPLPLNMDLPEAENESEARITFMSIGEKHMVAKKVDKRPVLSRLNELENGTARVFSYDSSPRQLNLKVVIEASEQKQQGQNPRLGLSQICNAPYQKQMTMNSTFLPSVGALSPISSMQPSTDVSPRSFVRSKRTDTETVTALLQQQSTDPLTFIKLAKMRRNQIQNLKTTPQMNPTHQAASNNRGQQPMLIPQMTQVL